MVTFPRSCIAVETVVTGLPNRVTECDRNWEQTGCQSAARAAPPAPRCCLAVNCAARRLLLRRVNGDAVFKLGAQQTTDKAIRRWVKRAGIEKKISFHNARHTFATILLILIVKLIMSINESF